MERYEGKIWIRDMGIVIGEISSGRIGGIFVYEPQNDLVPNQAMSERELFECFGKAPFVNLPYSTVKQVMVNDFPVWRNRDHFDLRSLGIDPNNQTYWGRGNVSVELNDKGLDCRVDQFMDKIIKRFPGRSKDRLVVSS